MISRYIDPSIPFLVFYFKLFPLCSVYLPVEIIKKYIFLLIPPFFFLVQTTLSHFQISKTDAFHIYVVHFFIQLAFDGQQDEQCLDPFHLAITSLNFFSDLVLRNWILVYVWDVYVAPKVRSIIEVVEKARKVPKDKLLNKFCGLSGNTIFFFFIYCNVVVFFFD